MMDNYFKLNERGTDFKTEIMAGITTFLAMAYILGVNPTLLAEGGMPAEGVFFSTAIASGIACIVMGLISNYPVGLAPGMGLNALFSYTIILDMGYTWEAALAAVFVSSVIFLTIVLSGLRERILKIIPVGLKLGIASGIGFFLAFMGFRSAGIIVADPTTFVAMGNLLAPHALLALIGIFITVIFYVQKVPVGVFFGLVITAIIGLVFHLWGFGAGNILMPTIPKTLISFNFNLSLFAGFLRGFGQLFSNIPNLILILFTLVFVAFFDTTGTLISLGKLSGFVNEDGEVVGIERAFLGVSLNGIIGSIFGTSTLSAYVESATGIGNGGRTGLTAIITGICFILAIFFAPLILSLFTAPVTASALIIVGILMVSQLREVQWDNAVISVSVFITIVMMILTSSISLGIAWGFVTFAIAKIATGEFDEISWGVWLLALIFILYLFFGL